MLAQRAVLAPFYINLNTQAIEVEKIPLDEAASFLLRRSKAIGLETLGTEVVEEKFTQAREIAGLADGLPLMLEQSGAYIEATGCGLAGYITDYEAQGALLRQKPKLPEAEYPHTVATAWLMSFDRVRQASPVAANLLSLFAFVAPDAIPEEMITEAAVKLGPVLSTLADNPQALNDAMAQFRKYSLVKRHEETKTCSIHSLVQAVIQDEMDEEEQQVWAERVVLAVHYVFPLVEAETLQRGQRYLPSALMCLQHIEQWDMVFPEAAELLGQLGFYFLFQGQYPLAERFFRQALSSIFEKIPEKVEKVLELADYLSFLLGNLEYACLKQGKLDDAEEWFNVEVGFYVEGGGYPGDIAFCLMDMEDMAELYKHKGMREAATQWLEASDDHVDDEQFDDEQELSYNFVIYDQVDHSMEKLHDALQKKQYKAAAIVLRGLRVKADMLERMSQLYEANNNLEEAIKHSERVLTIYRRVFDSMHQAVIESLYNLARLYSLSGKHEKARRLFEELRVKGEKLYEEGPSEIIGRTLALSYYFLGQLHYEEDEDMQAKEAYIKALAIAEKLSDSDDDDIRKRLIEAIQSSLRELHK